MIYVQKYTQSLFVIYVYNIWQGYHDWGLHTCHKVVIMINHPLFGSQVSSPYSPFWKQHSGVCSRREQCWLTRALCSLHYSPMLFADSVDIIWALVTLGFRNHVAEPNREKRKKIGAGVPVDQRTSFANDSAFHSWILWILRRWPHSWRRSHCLHVSKGKFPKLTLSNPELVPQWFSHILQEV